MKMSLEQLNKLLARALVELGDDGLTIVTADQAMKPWLPESYWREQFDIAEKVVDRRRVRQAEDRYLAEKVSVADILEEGIPSLWAPEVNRTNWGLMPMKHSGGTLAPPTTGEQQPAYNWQCYQCGRPITDEGYDHAHKTRCDHALMDASEAYPDHQAKPWHGEEEDEGDA